MEWVDMKQVFGGVLHGMMKCDFCGFEIEKHWLHSKITEKSHCPECGKKTGDVHVKPKPAENTQSTGGKPENPESPTRREK